MGRKSRSKWERRKAGYPEWKWKPSWYHPALFGAAFLFAVVSIRVVVALPYLVQHPRKVPEFMLMPALAAVAGAAGGFAYSFLGAPLRRIPQFGRYLAGIVTMGGYMGAFFLVASFAPEPLIETWDTGAIVSFTTVILGFGLYFGHVWFENH